MDLALPVQYRGLCDRVRPLPNAPEHTGRGRAITPNVLALGLVSLLMALSSQMTNSLLPVFLVTAMGASIATVGLIEGLAEATNSFLRAFSGAISDAIGRRKPLVVFGDGLSACVKPVFPMAGPSTLRQSCPPSVVLIMVNAESRAVLLL